MLETWILSAFVIVTAVVMMMLEYDVDERKDAGERKGFGASATLMLVCRVNYRERVHGVA